MCFGDNQAGAPNYFPNSFNGPQCDKKTAVSKVHYSGDMERIETGDEDNFSQPNIFYNKTLRPDERKRLIENIAGNLKDATDFIQVNIVIFLFNKMLKIK